MVFYFYAVLAYQTTVLLKKANLCPDISYEGLKKITEESGIQLVELKGEVSRKFAVISKPKNVCLSAETKK